MLSVRTDIDNTDKKDYNIGIKIKGSADPHLRRHIKMKKIISLLLAVLMLSSFAVASVPAGAEDYFGDIEFSMSNASGMQNDEITIDLNIDDSTGFYAFVLFVYYDSNNFILRDVTYNDDLLKYGDFEVTPDNVPADRMTGAAWKATKDVFADYNIGMTDKEFKTLFFIGKDYTKNIDFKGTMAQLTFQIQGVANDGEYEIGIMPAAGGNVININDKDSDLRASWSNAIVRVGTNDVSKDTAPVRRADETLDPSETTKEAETMSREDMESMALEDDTEPVETFIGEDGNAYVTNEDGETELYVEPETEETKGDDETAEAGSEDIAPVETEEDVEGDDKRDEPNTVKLFGKDVPIIYLIAAALLVLIAAAAVIFIILKKTNKSDVEIDNK